ncbi:hypothetical protein ACOMHN_016280 [Nucella lapillus]
MQHPMSRPKQQPMSITWLEFIAIPKWWMEPLEASTREPVQLLAALSMWQVVSKESDDHHGMAAHTLAVVLVMASLALRVMLLVDLELMLAVLELVVLAVLELVVLAVLELVVLADLELMCWQT